MDRLRADASLSLRLLAAPALLAVRSAAASVGAARPRGRWATRRAGFSRLMHGNSGP